MMIEIGRNDPCPCGSGKKWKKCHGNPARENGSASPLDALLEALELNQDETIESVASSLSALTRELQPFDPHQVIIGACGLATLANNHTRIFRIDALIHLAAIYSGGSQVPTIDHFARWLNVEIPRSNVRRFEDPPEDFAVGNVCTGYGDRLVFNGEWSAPDRYLQDVLDALDTGPQNLSAIRRSSLALLSLSDEMARRRGYSRLTAGDTDVVDVEIPPTDEELWQISRSVNFENATVAQLGFHQSDLAPFALSLEELRSDAPQQKVIQVRRRPLLRIGDLLAFVFPTSVAMAIVSFVLSRIQELGMIPALNSALRMRQLHDTVAEATRDLQVIDSENQMLPKLGNVPPKVLSQAAFRFDHDKHMHLVILHDELDSVCNNGIDNPWQPSSRDAIARHIEISATALATQSDYTGGLTILIMAGVGRAYQIATPNFLPEGWFLQVWSSADLTRLMWLEPDWKLTLWKLSMQRSVLMKAGIEFTTPNDANLYAMLAHDDYHLVPAEIIDTPHADIVVGCGHIFELRSDARRRIDEHSVYRPDRREWLRVCCTARRAYFKEDMTRQTFASPERARLGILEGAVESPLRTWWVDCHTSTQDAFGRHYIYKIWETALNWLERIASTLDRMLPELSAGNIIIELDLSPVANHSDWRSQTIKEIAAVNQFPVEISSGRISLQIPMAFVAMGHDPQNRAERLLVRTFVQGVALLAGVDQSDQRLSNILEELAIRDEQRFMHTFEARDNRDFLREFDAAAPTLLKDVDVHFASVGVAQEASLPVPAAMTETLECNEALNSIVDALWLRCKKRLGEINRVSIVRDCLINNERILSDQDNWQRTRRAVVAMHANQEDVISASRAAKENRDRTQITHRVIIEMAICTCPESKGRAASQSDIDYLGSQILLLIAAAAQSDAVRSGAVTPSIRTSLAGDFRLESDLMQVMQPYLSSHFERSHLRDVSNYEQYYEASQRGTKSENEVFGEAFVTAFRTEFGISPARLGEVGNILTEDAITHKTTVIERNRKDIEELLVANGFGENEVTGLLENFVLYPRPNWDSVSPPFRGKDWWPWRYRRRLSLMTRPIVAISESNFLYAPGFCEDSFRHVVMECYTGAFETEYFGSRAMKEYIGRENARRGLAFNKAVAKIFEDAGWRIRLEVAMSELKAPENLATGDVDVLAWKDGSVCLCECKELLFARTITEVSEQLKRFRGKKGDDLSKHLRRVEWVSSNPESLRCIVGDQITEFRSFLVTSKVVPMHFAGSLPVEMFSADQLADELGTSVVPIVSRRSQGC